MGRVEEVESTASTDGVMSLRPDHVRKPVASANGEAGDTDSTRTLVIVGIVLLLAAGATVVGVAAIRARR